MKLSELRSKRDIHSIQSMRQNLKVLCASIVSTMTKRTCQLAFGVCAAIALLGACAPLPPRTTLALSRVMSPNFDERRPNIVVIHHTSDNTLQEAIDTLTSARLQVSSHYLIGRDGKIIQLVEENVRAWHAGKSWWGGVTDLNSTSLGIELDNNGVEPFADAQIDALLTLLSDIRLRYNIPSANFIGHADVAPGRKDDPSVLFPWKKLATHGFGLWCDTPLTPTAPEFDLVLAITALGYDPSKPEASHHAFQQHFVGGDKFISADEERSLAQCLLQKRASEGR
jgi:N-acetylmuramoyl-L-alanine amidase